jgi:hypothetical protein
MGRLDNVCRSQWPRGLRRRPWSLGRWGRRFESRLRHGCLSSSFYVALLCVSRDFCDGLITRPKEPYQNRLWNVQCDAAKVLTRTVEPLMMMMMTRNVLWYRNVNLTVVSRAMFSQNIFWQPNHGGKNAHTLSCMEEMCHTVLCR